MLQVFELKTEHKAKMSFHCSLYKMHLILWKTGTEFQSFFAQYLCFYHFSNYSQFLWKERDQNFRQRAQGKEKNQLKNNAYSQPPPQVFFLYQGKDQNIIVSNFVQDLVPVKYCLTSVSVSSNGLPLLEEHVIFPILLYKYFLGQL